MLLHPTCKAFTNPHAQVPFWMNEISLWRRGLGKGNFRAPMRSNMQHGLKTTDLNDAVGEESGEPQIQCLKPD